MTFNKFITSLKLKTTNPALLIIILVLLSSSAYAQSTNRDAIPNYYTQSNSNRTAAEWEPAIGTLIVWPLSIPYKLVVELAKDNHVYTLVENETTKKEAMKWYSKWGINPKNNSFIFAPQGVDAWWTRDWGPSAIFTPEGKMMLGDGKYYYSTPVTGFDCNDSLEFLIGKDNKVMKTDIDDNATVPLGKGLNIEVLDLPYTNTGGNVITDGLGTAFSSCILLNENQFYHVSRDKFLKLNKELSGFERYNILSNFEKAGIQHIDCLMKLLDEERILVAEPPKDHELYPVYENIVQNELKHLKNAYGRPYEILRLKTARYSRDRLAAYTNSIIVNKTIYVPLFHIKEDSAALKTWQKVLPGYTVKGFEFDLKDEPIVSQDMKDHYTNLYGWNSGDALHCRTRAVWDAQMLFITTKRIDAEVDAGHKNIVYTSIIDYSKKGLVNGKTALFWRVVGEKDWNTIPFTQADGRQHFYAEIPYHTSGKTIEYYVSAVSNSGRMETQPRTAPAGTYQFKIK